MIDVSAVFDWLVQGAPGAANPVELLAAMCKGLSKAGVPIHRAEAFVRTLHPTIAGRSFVWRPDAPVAVHERSFGYLNSPGFMAGPTYEAVKSGEYVRRDPRLDPALAEFAQDGHVDFLAAPLRFLSGENHVVTYLTREPGGFTAEQIEAIQRLVAPLARVGEIFALLRTATNLLSTYVGHNAGERILKGKIHLGDTEEIEAVIWFSDLRGFTALTGSTAPASVIRALNDLFGCQIPAIEKNGGEILKFIGDGLLAIFPYDEKSAPAGARCDAALRAAHQAFAALEELNASRKHAGDAPIEFGMALHLGAVSYGNIGGASRLDFTAIGPAVNVASRLEAVASKLGRPIVLSEAFAKLASEPTESLGSFALKGVERPQIAFAPAATSKGDRS